MCCPYLDLKASLPRRVRLARAGFSLKIAERAYGLLRFIRFASLLFTGLLAALSAFFFTLATAFAVYL